MKPERLAILCLVFAVLARGGTVSGSGELYSQISTITAAGVPAASKIVSCPAGQLTEVLVFG